MIEFKIPELGENVAGGDVMSVLVKVGDTVALEQPILELETDKATIEVPSSVAGVVKEIKVKKGDTIKVGAVVLTVDAPASANGGSVPAAHAAKPASPEPDAPPAAQPSAPPKVLPMPVRQTAQAPQAQPAQEPPAAPAPGAVAMPPRTDGRAAPASPAVRRLAREIGVKVNDVEGTGPGGRISLDDVKEHARRILSSIGAAGGVGPGSLARPGKALPDFARWGAVDRQAWTNIRRATAEHLGYAWNTIPHVTQFDKADVTALEELRKRHKEQVATAGGNLTVTAMLVRILATAVHKFPQFNASLDSERGEIVFKKYVNVGVAVDTDRGLLVPVIRNADQKNITQIAVELHHAAERARERKLTMEEMSGGGITISNLGGIGGTYFTPIVNWPEVAILGVSRGVIEPVWRNETFEPCQRLPLALSYDHRVIDGADAMRFLRWVVEAIEQPFLLSLVG
ncbi:MAG TPA: 2-oxo acid dehydrogenase subunit E2 [Vicinamibacterales bacterium]|nr:2-oxo acid dehydrogenase subunit E2 [Vicinamibacterales bacterium]